MKRVFAFVLSCAGVSSIAFAQSQTSLPTATKKEIQLDIENPIKPAAAVPITEEPHHVPVLRNEYVHVFNVTVPGRDATMLHQHDLPYLYLTLGTTDIINAVAGKPEVHMKIEDGTTRYSPGGFAHIARTNGDDLFHNITVELARPQGSLRNLGDGSDDRPLGSCPQSTADPKQKEQSFRPVVPCFETDELRMDLVSVASGKDFSEESPRTAALLIAMSDANLDVTIGEEHAGILHAADVLWLPAGTARRVSDFLGIRSQFLLISFKDSGASVSK
jgi:hypothetical protein